MYDARIVFLGVYMVLKQKCLVQSKSDYLRRDLYKITKEEIDLLYEATKSSFLKTTYGFHSAKVSSHLLSTSRTPALQLMMPEPVSSSASAPRLEHRLVI